MSRVSIEYSEDLWPEKGQWNFAGDSTSMVIIMCPDCGEKLCLPHPDGKPPNRHWIEATGNIERSVICDCGFHKFIMLDRFQEVHGKDIT